MDAQTVLYFALAVAVVVFVAVLSIVLLSIKRNVDQITQRLDESLRQFEMTAEDARKTNAAIREIITDVGEVVSDVTHFTEGIRSLRRPVDVVANVFEHALSPALVGAASVLVGFKAATSHILDRFVRKEVGK
ncbi:MAG: hypothetical protein ACM3OG_10255 [Actinomycetota bacterium]